MTLILNFMKAFAFVLLLSLGMSCNSNNGSSTETPKVDGSLPAGAVNIAYVQVDSVIKNYDMYHDKTAEFEKKAKAMEAEFSAKVQSFQKDAADFQEKVEKGLVTRSQGEELQVKLQRRQQDLETTRNKMTSDLGEQESVILRQIQDALLKYIDKYNQDKKYTLILNGATVLYGLPAMNITDDIVKGMNEEYIAGKDK